MKKHSKNKKGKYQKDTNQVIPLNKNHMQKKKTSLGSRRRDLKSTKVRSLSNALILVK
jgi:hypothetical protein